MLRGSARQDLSWHHHFVLGDAVLIRPAADFPIESLLETRRSDPTPAGIQVVVKTRIEGSVSTERLVGADRSGSSGLAAGDKADSEHVLHQRGQPNERQGATQPLCSLTMTQKHSYSIFMRGPGRL